MTKTRPHSPQNKNISSPRRGRSALAQQPEQPEQPAPQTRRESSSMSRGRTRRPTDEYARPPRDPAAYETSSAEEFVYSDSRGGFSARRDADARSGPGRYQSQMLGEFTPKLLAPGEAPLRQREKDAGGQAAHMTLAEREAQHLPTNSGRGALRYEDRPGKGLGQHPIDAGKRSRKSVGIGRASGCCLIF